VVKWLDESRTVKDWHDSAAPGPGGRSGEKRSRLEATSPDPPPMRGDGYPIINVPGVHIGSDGRGKKRPKEMVEYEFLLVSKNQPAEDASIAADANELPVSRFGLSGTAVAALTIDEKK